MVASSGNVSSSFTTASFTLIGFYLLQSPNPQTKNIIPDCFAKGYVLLGHPLYDAVISCFGEALFEVPADGDHRLRQQHHKRKKTGDQCLHLQQSVTYRNLLWIVLSLKSAKPPRRSGWKSFIPACWAICCNTFWKRGAFKSWK